MATVRAGNRVAEDFSDRGLNLGSSDRHSVGTGKKLSADERATLMDALHDLNVPPDPEWEAAWIRECADRLAALDRGEMQTYDGDQVMAEARARLKRIA